VAIEQPGLSLDDMADADPIAPGIIGDAIAEPPAAPEQLAAAAGNDLGPVEQG
jgi:hypothetical protein